MRAIYIKIRERGTEGMGEWGKVKIFQKKDDFLLAFGMGCAKVPASSHQEGCRRAIRQPSEHPRWLPQSRRDALSEGKKRFKVRAGRGSPGVVRLVGKERSLVSP